MYCFIFMYVLIVSCNYLNEVSLTLMGIIFAALGRIPI